MLKKSFFVFFILLGVSVAYGQKNVNRVQLDRKSKAYESNLTHPELRAEEGSMSKYSVKAFLSYYGPPVATPLASEQPNPDNKVGDYKVALSGSMSGRYRINSSEVLSAGSGLKALTPFHGLERVDLKSPYLKYSKSLRFHKVQMRLTSGVSVTTQKAYTDAGQVGALSGSYSMKYKLGQTNLRLSLSTSLNIFIYNRAYNAKTDRTSSRYFLGVYPGIDYRLSDNYTVQTSLSTSFANPRKDEKWQSLNSRTITQRLGVSIALSKTTFLYPYFNFYPEKFTWETTTLSFNTIFSVF